MNAKHRRAGLGIVLSLWPLMAAAADEGVPPQDPKPSLSPLANPLVKQSLSSLDMTRQRPLFAPSRHKPPPPEKRPVVAVTPPPQPPPPPTVSLLGIVKEDDGTRAVLKSGGSDKVVRVRIGDDVGGWKIAEITARRVTLSLDDRTSVVGLFEAPSVRYYVPLRPAGKGPQGQAARR